MRFLIVITITSALLGCRSVGGLNRNCGGQNQQCTANNCSQRSLGLTWLHIPIPIPTVQQRRLPAHSCQRSGNQIGYSNQTDSVVAFSVPGNQPATQKQQLENRTMELEAQVSRLVDLLNESADEEQQPNSIIQNDIDPTENVPTSEITRTAATETGYLSQPYSGPVPLQSDLNQIRRTIAPRSVNEQRIEMWPYRPN